MKTLLALSAATLALAAAGCGSNDKSSSGSSSGSSSSGSSSGGGSSSSGAAQSGNVAVTIKGFAFNPDNLTVKKGTKITWTNQDSAPHNVVGGELKSTTLNQGDSYTYTADKAGTISYVCTFHANMKATLTVTG